VVVVVVVVVADGAVIARTEAEDVSPSLNPMRALRSLTKGKAG
jgi:hypothetical protein